MFYIRFFSFFFHKLQPTLLRGFVPLFFGRAIRLNINRNYVTISYWLHKSDTISVFFPPCNRSKTIWRRVQFNKLARKPLAPWNSAGNNLGVWYPCSGSKGKRLKSRPFLCVRFAYNKYMIYCVQGKTIQSLKNSLAASAKTVSGIRVLHLCFSEGGLNIFRAPKLHRAEGFPLFASLSVPLIMSIPKIYDIFFPLYRR